MKKRQCAGRWRPTVASAAPKVFAHPGYNRVTGTDKCAILTMKSGKMNIAIKTEGENVMSKAPKRVRPTRRNFLRVAAAAASASAVAAPAVVSAQGPISMRWQSTWPSKDIFHEFAQDYAKKVNDMTGGDLRIEVLPAGAVVPPFGLLDAVSKGTLDGGHGALVYHYGKQPALALWGSGPGYAMDANMLLAWHKYLSLIHI